MLLNMLLIAREDEKPAEELAWLAEEEAAESVARRTRKAMRESSFLCTVGVFGGS